MTEQINEILTWKDCLQDFYAHWLFLKIKTRSGSPYGKSFLIEKRIEAEKTISQNNRKLLNEMWRTNECVYCGKTITAKKTEGDHPIAILKEWNNDDYNYPCCIGVSGCNNSKQDKDFLDWWTQSHNIIDIKPNVLFVYLRAKWFVLKTQDVLLQKPDDSFIKHLEHLKELNNIRIIEAHEIMSFQSDFGKNFRALNTKRTDWQRLAPTSIEEDHEGFDMPTYNNPPIQGYRKVSPIDDKDFEQKDYGVQRCQLCSTKITRYWFIVNHKEKLVMQVGSECYKIHFNDNEDPIKTTVHELIIKQLIKERPKILELYWEGFRRGAFTKKKLAYDFSITLKRLEDDRTHFDLAIFVLRAGIELGFRLSPEIKKLVPKLRRKKLSRDLGLEYEE